MAVLHVPAPWDASVDLDGPEPARFYIGLVAQTLQYGEPATRRGGPVWAAVGRRGLPETALAAVLRRGGRLVAGRSHPDVLPSTADVAAAWPALRAADDTLPAAPPPLRALSLRRASARTVFLFAPGATAPLLVAKTAHGSSQDVVREADALRAAAASGIAPRHLGELDGLGHVQRGLPGRALPVVPIRPRDAATLSWTPAHAALADGLVALARTTARRAVPRVVADDVVEHGLTSPLVDEETRAAVRRALSRVREDAAAVLVHSDASPQNVLVEGSRLAGLVDWSEARPDGLPGADAWNAAVAWLDKGVGLVSGDERTVHDVFARAWTASPFAARARQAARAAAAAAGAADDRHDDRELVFFARRVGHRLRRAADFPTSADLAARVLVTVRKTSSRARPQA